MIIESTDIKQVEVCNESIEALIVSFPEYLKEFALTILYTHHINEPEPNKWYNFNNFLKALNDIESKFGADTLYMIGKKTLDCFKLAGKIKNLKDALSKLESAINANHRNMEICWLTVEELNLSTKKIVLYLENPYPLAFNRGVLTALSREYPPEPSAIPEVKIDESESLPTKGKYIITW